MRPLKVPASAKERNDFWEADVEVIKSDAKNRIIDNGRGAYGVVDPELAKDISDLTNADK